MILCWFSLFISCKSIDQIGYQKDLYKGKPYYYKLFVKRKPLKEISYNVETGTRLVIDMKVKDDGIEAKVTLGENEKIYFFPFTTGSDQSNRIDLFISPLPLKFYIDAFLEHIKK